jgi:apolipoprotein N-acyltransferase
MKALSLTSLAGIGIGVSFAFLPAMALMFLMPAIAFLQPSRRLAFLAAFSYYLGASWAIIPSIRNFFGPEAGPASGFLLWLTASILLALPWPLVWSANRRQALWRIPVGIILGVLPPLGIIGWASPLLSAGLLFPGTAWFGLAAVAVLPAWIIVRPKPALSAAVAAALTANVAYPGSPSPPRDWEAVNTEFGPVAPTPRTPRADFAAAQWIQDRATQPQARVIVLPESVVPVWTDATALMWKPTLDRLASTGKTLVIGVCLPAPGRVGAYRNAVLVLGARPRGILQRVPVPLGMWKPLSSGGVPLNLLGAGTAAIGGERAAILICYEQLLTWPILVSLLEHPTLIVGVANNCWTSTTPIWRCQRESLRLWSALFRIPHLAASNR